MQVVIVVLQVVIVVLQVVIVVLQVVIVVLQGTDTESKVLELNITMVTNRSMEFD